MRLRLEGRAGPGEWESPVISHQSPVISHQSSVTSHQSSVISHQSSEPLGALPSQSGRASVPGDVVTLGTGSPPLDTLASYPRNVSNEGDDKPASLALPPSSSARRSAAFAAAAAPVLCMPMTTAWPSASASFVCSTMPSTLKDARSSATRRTGRGGDHVRGCHVSSRQSESEGHSQYGGNMLRAAAGCGRAHAAHQGRNGRVVTYVTHVTHQRRNAGVTEY